MLNGLTLESFRAFSFAQLKFSKLNIFVGPNNSGKSSIISAINLIAQNVPRGTQQYSLALNGPYTDLGTFHDAVHGHSARSAIGIGFDIDDFSYYYKFRYRAQRREIELVRTVVSSKGAYYVIAATKESHVTKLRPAGSYVEEILEQVRPSFFGGLIQFGRVPFIGEQRTQTDIYNRAFRELNLNAMGALERQFNLFDAVGAFRSTPQRTYNYTGEAPSSVGKFGENVAQMLASSASRRQRIGIKLNRRVASWFQASGIAADIDINSLTNRHFEIIVSDSTGATNNISDSGFGCSQVLPVLVGGYNLIDGATNLRRPIYVVQEPEIHLHPTAAAHLGSYFVELTQSGAQCFVETHSENLVLRVARHVALGDISPQDVQIYWVSGASGTHKATPMSLSADGTFSHDWPEGFFPTRSEETLSLARAASRSRTESEKGGS